MSKWIVPLFLILISFSVCSSKMDADLILYNAAVYTMEVSQPWASAVVIKGNKILAVLDDSSNHEKYVGPETQLIDLSGRFVIPGFIDGHVHFNRAGEMINDVNLLTVSDDSSLRREIARIAKILDDDEWIVGGLWGAYEQWQLHSSTSTATKRTRWQPHRRIIDDLTPHHPCLLCSYDNQFFLANTTALKIADLLDQPVAGMMLEAKDQPTGLILRDSPAIKMIQSRVKAKSHLRLLNENRAALRRLAECGIVEIHDIATPEQTARFVELQKSGELTCRVWLRPDLSRAEEMREEGFTMGLHPVSRQRDQWLRYGALKGYIDGIMGTHGALFFESYLDQPDNSGHYRRHTSDDEHFQIPNMEKMYKMIKTGFEAGFVANVHAIGTKGVALMLDTYERLSRELGTSLEGFRVIHAQVVRQQDFKRFKKLNVIAEVNPYHISDDMRWMEERIGHERCKGAYAFKSLIDNGARLCFGSDWPGTSAAEYHVHPKYLIHAAVNRTTLNGTPAEGWFPEQKISVHEALKAYTINNAYAAFDGATRGSIKAGKLADLTVIDRNLLDIEPTEILKMKVEMTIIDGRIIFRGSSL